MTAVEVVLLAIITPAACVVVFLDFRYYLKARAQRKDKETKANQ